MSSIFNLLFISKFSSLIFPSLSPLLKLFIFSFNDLFLRFCGSISFPFFPPFCFVLSIFSSSFSSSSFSEINLLYKFINSFFCSSFLFCKLSTIDNISFLSNFFNLLLLSFKSVKNCKTISLLLSILFPLLSFFKLFI